MQKNNKGHRKLTELKQRLITRQLTIGSWLSFCYPPVCEMMAKSGFDWLVIDMEHTAVDFKDAQNLIQIIDLAGCTPLVRVGANDPLMIKRVMDAGAHGVVVPMVNSKYEAQRAVDAVYYPPRGSRGVGLYRAQNYGMGFDDYQIWAKENSVVIVQIEHREAVKNLEEILSVDGVDGFMVGPYDLSGSFNRPGDFSHPDILKALTKIEKVMQDSEKPGGYHIVHSDSRILKERIKRGYRFIAYGNEMVFLSEKLKKEISVVNQFLKRAERSLG